MSTPVAGDDDAYKEMGLDGLPEDVIATRVVRTIAHKCMRTV